MFILTSSIGQEKLRGAADGSAGAPLDSTGPPSLPSLLPTNLPNIHTRIHARTEPRVIHPVGLRMRGRTWTVEDALRGEILDVAALGDLNISSKTFSETR